MQSKSSNDLGDPLADPSGTAEKTAQVAQRYHIYRNGTLVGSTTSPVFTDSSVSSNTNYSYTVVAYDAGGNNSTATVAMTAATLGGTNGAGYPTAVLLILKTNPNNTQTDTSNQMSLEVLRPN